MNSAEAHGARAWATWVWWRWTAPARRRPIRWRWTSLRQTGWRAPAPPPGA